MSRTYRAARDKVRAKWGQEVRHLVGDTIYQALIAEAVFFVCAAQDESVSGEVVRQIISECHSDLTSEMTA